jgi:hypothetical protein
VSPSGTSLVSVTRGSGKAGNNYYQAGCSISLIQEVVLWDGTRRDPEWSLTDSTGKVQSQSGSIWFRGKTPDDQLQTRNTRFSERELLCCSCWEHRQTERSILFLRYHCSTYYQNTLQQHTSQEYCTTSHAHSAVLPSMSGMLIGLTPLAAFLRCLKQFLCLKPLHVGHRLLGYSIAREIYSYMSSAECLTSIL